MEDLRPAPQDDGGLTLKPNHANFSNYHDRFLPKSSTHGPTPRIEQKQFPVIQQYRIQFHCWTSSSLSDVCERALNPSNRIKFFAEYPESNEKIFILPKFGTRTTSAPPINEAVCL